jgi:hypothetical protein
MTSVEGINSLPHFEGAQFQQLVIPSIVGSRHYRVDLVNYTCTCPEFPDRLRYPPTNRHRACPHIEIAVERYHPGFFDSALRNEITSMAARSGAAMTWFPANSQVAIAHSPGNEWCDVYLIANYRYQRFGYSLQQQRWSYGHPPPQGEEIAAFIIHWTAVTAERLAEPKRGFWHRVRAAFGL